MAFLRLSLRSAFLILGFQALRQIAPAASSIRMFCSQYLLPHLAPHPRSRQRPPTRTPSSQAPLSPGQGLRRAAASTNAAAKGRRAPTRVPTTAVHPETVSTRLWTTDR